MSGSCDCLSHLLDVFRAAVVGGVQDYYDRYQDTAHVHRPTTMRSIMRDHIVDRLRLALSGKLISVMRIRTRPPIFIAAINSGFWSSRVRVELAKTQRSFNFQCNDGQFVLDPAVILQM